MKVNPVRLRVCPTAISAQLATADLLSEGKQLPGW